MLALWVGVTTLIRVALGVVFLWSSSWKLYQPYEFLRLVYNYNLLGATTGVIVATVIPWLELVLGLALILNILKRGSAFVSTLLLLFFILAQVFSLWQGQENPCGCFNGEGEVIGIHSLLLTGSALVGSIILTFSLCLLPRGLHGFSESPVRSSKDCGCARGICHPAPTSLVQVSSCWRIDRPLYHLNERDDIMLKDGFTDKSSGKVCSRHTPLLVIHP